jgi:hypothetical protein
MRNGVIAFTFAMLLPWTALLAQSTSAADTEAEAVKATIVTAYIQGLNNEKDVDKIWSGFHPDFKLLYVRDDSLHSFTIQQWVTGVERNPTPPEIPVHHEFTAVHVAGNAAIAQFEVYREDIHLFSDFMSLYRFEDGWKIVNKISYAHPR